MNSDGMSLIIHPAGRDEALRVVVEDLRMGHWHSTRDLLARTGDDWALRTARSQVIASVDPSGENVRAWRQDEPNSPDALMMWGRTLTEGLLAASRRGPVPYDVVERARQACGNASQAYPSDPVPWVCQLALTVLDTDPLNPHRPHHWGRTQDPMLPRGPWKLLDQVHARHPEGSREAFLRMYQCLHARRYGALDFACWANQVAPEGSPVQPLVLHAYAALARERLGNGQIGNTLGFWQDGQVVYCTERVRDHWFRKLSHPEAAPLTDLNHLAYALTATGLSGAAEVFEAIGPYATPAPWEDLSVTGYWTHDFHTARRGALRRWR